MARAPSFNSQQISHHLDRHAQSGLSIAQYCQEHSINPGCFYNWRCTRNKKAPSSCSKSAAQQSDWIELTPPALQPAVAVDVQFTTTLVELSLPGGIVLQIKSV